MFNKYKDQFIEWIENKIGIGELRRNLHRLRTEVSSLRGEVATLRQASSTQNSTIADINNRLSGLMGLVDVGLDVNLVRHGSWAVVCLKGKSQYIKFVRIDETSLNEMVEFLNKYKDANVIVDAPYGVQNLITSAQSVARKR